MAMRSFCERVYFKSLRSFSDPGGVNHWTTNISNGDISPGEALLKIIAGAQGSDITILENKIDVAGLDTECHRRRSAQPEPCGRDEARSNLVFDDTTQSDDARDRTTRTSTKRRPSRRSAGVTERCGPRSTLADAEDDGSTLTYSVTGNRPKAPHRSAALISPISALPARLPGYCSRTAT